MELKVSKLYAKSKDDKEILKDFNLTINSSEVHVLMGPNGCGKSTLSKVILRSPEYNITGGDILINGESIKESSTDEVARKGVFMVFQNPISIDGVSNSEFLRTAYGANHEQTPIFSFIKEVNGYLKELHMNEDMIHRSINKDFSGGERKKNEILQLRVLKPELIILDELDSGLDIDSLKIVSDSINNYMKENKNASLLIITHYEKILDYIKPDKVHVMKDGHIVKTGDESLAKELLKTGYESLGE